MASTVILWFRRDLRLAHNPALNAALASGAGIVPVYIWAPQEDGAWTPGLASRWWLHQSLTALAERLKQIGVELGIYSGSSSAVLEDLVSVYEAGAVYCNRVYEPLATQRDAAVSSQLVKRGVRLYACSGSLLLEPDSIMTAQGGPYRVFTPFSTAALRVLQAPGAGMPEGESDPGAALDRLARQHARFTSAKRPVRPAPVTLASLPLLAAGMDYTGYHEATPGEICAQQRLAWWLEHTAREYAGTRDQLGADGTSRLSAYLHFGELLPQQVWHAVSQYGLAHTGIPGAVSAQAFLRQLLWREFAYYTLHHFPHITSEPLRSAFAQFPWLDEAPLLAAWQEGATGYPLVDAAMRQLRHSGWMHNRARMIAASFLTKHLLQPWQEGARWFWEKLADADLANNSFGWQWTAGCGADAAPYFRVFNPVLQGRKFDADGAYVRRYVPELARLPAAHIHQPWTAPVSILAQSGIVLGRTYPLPLVEHQSARRRALAAAASISVRQG